MSLSLWIHVHDQYLAMRIRRTTAFRRFTKWPLPVLLFLCIICPFLLLNLVAQPRSLPSGFTSFHIEPSCNHSGNSPFSLHQDALCLGAACGGDCFLRVNSGICFSSSQVTICNPDYKDSMQSSGGSKIPSIMRFYGERLTLPVVRGRCERSKEWMKGLSLVADQRFLPYMKPNPHHEAEKLIPATLLMKHHGLSNVSLFWFSSKDDVSDWGRGFIEAMHIEQRLQYVNLPAHGQRGICFEDAILLSPPTNIRYIPDSHSNDWLRMQVLQHCMVPNRSASWPIKDAVILDRKGSRHLSNIKEIQESISDVLKIRVDYHVSGIGSFCDQVRMVAGRDFLLVPHGSQNVNLIFARHGATVIEVFPYLFFNTALRNYTHAAGVHVFPLLGTLPKHNIIMWAFSFLGWNACYETVRWCKNYSRRQRINVDPLELKSLLVSAGF